nr:SRPBCC domain-containing protein [uncultured Ruegeria sp.]
MDIHKTYHLDFPVEQVFAAWTSSETVIPPAQKMRVEPRLGGAYQLFMSRDDPEPSNSGTFLVFEENSRVKYSWEWYRDGEITEITVDFVPEARGTRINLNHSGFVKEQSRDMHDGGWDSYIIGL